MQSNQLVNFANEFDFMPDLALITISKVLQANVGRGELGGRQEERGFPQSGIFFPTLSKNRGVPICSLYLME